MVRRLVILPTLTKTLATGTSLAANADVTGQTLTPSNYVGFPAAGCDQYTYLRVGKAQVVQSQEIIKVDLNTRPWPVLQRSVGGSPLVAHDATHGISSVVGPESLKELIGVSNDTNLVGNAIDLNLIGDFIAATYNAITGQIDITLFVPDLNSLDSIDQSPRVLKTPVRVATTTAGTLASSFENGDTVDGVTLATNDRILIKDQAAPAENGIYTVHASGAPTRVSDANAAAEFVNFLVYVKEGTTNAGTVWAHTTTGAITLGSTALTFAQVGGGGGGGGATTLDDLSDVDAPSPSDGDVLTFNNGTGNWEAAAPSGGGGATFTGCRLHRSADVTLTGGLGFFLPLSFDTEDFDTDSFHSTVSNTGRITIPTGLGGTYLLGANVRVDTGPCSVILRKNGVDASPLALLTLGSDAPPQGPLVTLAALADGDYVEVGIGIDVDTTIVTVAPGVPQFWAMKVG